MFQSQQIPNLLYQKQIKKEKSEHEQVIDIMRSQQFGQKRNYSLPKNDSRLEYIKNKQKSMSNKDNIYNINENPQEPVKIYNNEPLNNTNKMQKECDRYLNTQINENKAKNMINIELDDEEIYHNDDDNPLEKMRKKFSKLNDKTQDPYSNKNYTNKSNSYMRSIPIINMINNKTFVNRMKTSGTFQNNGINIMRK